MAHATNFKWQRETRGEYRDRRKADKVAEQQTCYQQIDARDRSVCRVTGVYLVLGHADPHKRKERHHMDPRSLGGSHDTANVITISGFLHALIHAGKIHLSGDANLRDQDGKFCGVAYDRMTEGGWKTERLV